MTAPRPTLADVARLARVSLPTVSRVLNGREDCWASDDTRCRIREAADALGYRPNLSARALRSGRSHVLGFVSPGFQAGAVHTRPGGLTDAAEKAGYTVIVGSHPNDPVAEDRVIRRMVDRAVDGLAVYPVDTGPHHELRALVARGFPVVTFEGANLLDVECDDVSVDHRAVGRLQARHLLARGRRRLALIKILPEARVNAIRDEQIRDELARARAPEPLILALRRAPVAEIADPDAIYGGIRRLIRRHAGAFDALASFDTLASLAVRALLAQGLSVPGDVAVIGAGDGPLAGYGTLPLSSISTRDDWAGEKAFDLLMDRIRGPAPDRFRRLVSKARLIARQSTGG
jgi:DNA-binding LacI/PurR family transcriptional regulator